MNSNLTNKVIIVTGGSGFLGKRHCDAIKTAGGTPIIWDIVSNPDYESYTVDVTNKEAIILTLDTVINKYGSIYGLVNNVANDPKVNASYTSTWSRFETYDLDLWNNDLTVGLTSSFLCSQIVGRHMAKQNWLAMWLMRAVQPLLGLSLRCRVELVP